MRRTLRRVAAMNGFLLRLSLALAVIVCLAPGASAQSDSARRAAARAQFARAEQSRAHLEARADKERSAGEYQTAVNAYRRVYLVTPRAAEVPAALLAVGALYRQMGDRFDRKYFQSAVDAYQFLLHEYPETRYRQDALLTIGRIQKDDLGQPDLARKTFESFLAQHRQSPRAREARDALQDIADEQAQARKPAAPERAPEKSASADAPLKISQVTGIRTSTTPDYTRVIIDLDDAVQFDSARIRDPDRIYFDLHGAKLNSSLARKALDVDGGFLKGVRVSQYHAGVVRVVLDLAKAKDFSAHLLPDPYRLVVDVYGESVVAAKPAPKEQAASSQPQTAADLKPAQKAAGTDTADASASDKPVDNRVSPTPPRADVSATPQPANPPGARATRPPARSKSAHESAAAMGPAPAPQPTKDGDRSLTRALGLKIGRIVIDAGHGGHDTGTIGPTGLMEKDLCLDVALRLGKLIQQHLPGAEVVFTRSDDTFIPLEDRTAIANKAQADLFLSIHANSSPDHRARGVETYYLSLASSADALEVASRENALAQGSVHELQDLVQKIARNDKIEESREFAGDVQASLLKRLQRQSQGFKDRGVRKAPFVVLIGANMPSVLAEISFLSNPADEQALKKPDGRQRVAEGLYHGVESYLQSLNSVTYNPPKSAPLSTR